MNKNFVIRFAVLLLAPLTTIQAAEFHVATTGNDANPGTQAAPLRTIQHAANLAQPGDMITVHEGVYRERINPPRGGESDAKRITYQAAPGEKVEIKGSEVVKGWTKVEGDVWKTTLPNSFFGAFNPFNDLIHGDWFRDNGRKHHTGAIYLNGDWLIEAAKLDELSPSTSTAAMPVPKAKKHYLVNVAWLRIGTNEAHIAATTSAAKHGTQNASCDEGGDCIGYIEAGDWVRYERLDFGRHTDQVEIRAAAGPGGLIEIRLGAPGGELLGTCTVPNTGGWQTWSTFKVRIKPLSGKQNICLVFQDHKISEPKSPLWFAQVDKDNTTIWAQFKGVNPNEQLVEVNVRRTVFYPDNPGRNFITVRGFTMRHAATPWAPPTAEQIGLIGTHWSKGWIIENNDISYSKCCGIALGKYGDEWDNRAQSAEGYVGTIQRALSNGWNKATIGSHIVRNNHISHCEQTGIVGSLGCAFSTVTGNTIHDIHVIRTFTGAEVAGIKFHGAIDVEISRNHIYRSIQGIWLDWMAQGTHITGNLLHENHNDDMFVEVDHGPFLVDNNIFLSPLAVFSHSQGGAFVHNLIAGSLRINSYDARQTPFHKAHSTAMAGLHDNPNGDDRYYNNLFMGRGDLSQYDAARLPVQMDGNVFLKGAKPSVHEINPLLESDFDPAIELVEKAEGFYLEFKFGKSWTTDRTRKTVTTELLGKAVIPDVPFEHANGTPYRINTDYFGKARNEEHPSPGPFETPGEGDLKLKVW